MTPLETVRPFHCGAQYGDWTDSNCGADCAKAAKEEDYGKRCPCDIEQALLEAYVGDGTVPAEIGRRMGYVKLTAEQAPSYIWPCPEHDPPWKTPK